ncbi:hypothetical protein MHH81_03480 [Psychrobacillus sp. FSL H8-0484]|uniref:hypothetical protein n=1 Tax=Psychrobacillus sp. FSL H8-0484 TaxID=2921390 RepID=UPI0030F8C596
MNMKFKKTSAALLVATMTLTGAGYAWADENLFDTVDLKDVMNQNEKETEETPVATTGDTESVVTTEDSVGLDIKIPEGYPAGNLEALSKAYENAGSETAKAAIKRNAERAIAKFEASQQQETETPEVEEPKTEEPKTEEPVVEKPVVEEPAKVEAPKATTKKEEKSAEKEERKSLQAEQKEELKALKEEHKEERKALKEEYKAEKHENKKNNKEDK